MAYILRDSNRCPVCPAIPIQVQRKKKSLFSTVTRPADDLWWVAVAGWLPPDFDGVASGKFTCCELEND